MKFLIPRGLSWNYLTPLGVVPSRFAIVNRLHIAVLDRDGPLVVVTLGISSKVVVADAQNCSRSGQVEAVARTLWRNREPKFIFVPSVMLYFVTAILKYVGILPFCGASIR